MAEKPYKKREQAPYRKVVRKTWRKVTFRQLPSDMKLFMCYLWTGPDAAMPGLYYISPGTIADDLGTDSATVTERLRNGMGNGWFRYDETARLIFFPKWADYDPPPNENTVKSYMRQLLDLPESELRDCYAKTLEPYIQRYSVRLPEPFAQQYTQRFGTHSPSPSPIPSPKEIKSKSHCGDAAKRLDPHEELRREDLTKVVKIICAWPCMRGVKNPYGIAGKLVNVYKRDPVFACEVLKEKSDIFCLCKDASHLIASATATYQRASDIREIESRAHHQDDGTKRGGTRPISELLKGGKE